MNPNENAQSIFKGPKAVKEVIQGLVASGLDPAASHARWVRVSGVATKSGVASEHGLLVTLLWQTQRFIRRGANALAQLEANRWTGAERVRESDRPS